MVNLFYGCAFMWSQVKTEALPISGAGKESKLTNRKVDEIRNHFKTLQVFHVNCNN